jgi:DNA ligase-1
MIKRPMLADSVKDFGTIRYPALATPKLDGIRCLKVDGRALSRSFKPIPNKLIRGQIETFLPDGVDGELIAGSFNQTTSGVMTRTGSPVFKYYIFDYVKDDPNKPYQERMADLLELGMSNPIISTFVELVLPITINNEEQLLEYERKCLDEGYEGVMLRDPKGPYKFGRSTVREGWLLKVKRFEDSEAVVIGFEELMTNDNPQEVDELGYAKRATKKENLVPAGTLGSFRVRDLKTSQEFSVGSGMDAAFRLEVWNNQDAYVGKILKYKYFPTGSKDLPRFPIFIGFRDPRDM